MKERIRTAAFLLLPALLAGTALWCAVTRNAHFPVVGGMIAKAGKQQAALKRQIEQQQEVLKKRAPIADELNALKSCSFQNHADMVGELRSRTERIFNAAGARVQTIGNPRQLKGAPGIDLYELSLTAEMQTAELCIILQEFSKEPFLLWRAVNLRPNHMLKPEFSHLTVTVGAACFREANP